MIRYLISPRIFLMMIFSSITFFSLAFSGSEGDLFRGTPRNKQTTADTIPPKKQLSRITLDDQRFQDNRVNMQAVEDAMREVERSMQKLKNELGRDYDNHIKGSYRNALDEINWQEIQMAKQRALAEAQANFDYDIINKKIMLQQRRMLADTRKQMALGLQHIERDKRQMELAMRDKLNMNMRKANVKLREVKIKLDDLENLKTDLAKDGLIKQDERYEIEIKNGDLYINGKKQKNKVSEKYRNKYPKYFDKDNRLKLKNDNRKIEKLELPGEELI
ncbi:MAG: hypothetical protein QM763_00650 [Agriterribacter sp.]